MLQTVSSFQSLGAARSGPSPFFLLLLTWGPGRDGVMWPEKNPWRRVGVEGVGLGLGEGPEDWAQKDRVLDEG